MEQKRELNQELLEFVRKSGSMYHTVHTIEQYLQDAGFRELREQDAWEVEPEGRYYVKRNHSSIIAFRVGDVAERLYFKIAASHSDSPTFAVKDIPELSGPGSYLRLNVEPYGGMIDHTWLDRPLGVAGRVMVQTHGHQANAAAAGSSGETEPSANMTEAVCSAADAPWESRMESRLVYPDQDLFLIPSLCIHFDREVNKGRELNRQVDLCPLVSAGTLQKDDFDRMVAEWAGAAPEDVMGKNLFLVNRQEGRIWGAEDEFVSSPKLDDLQCAFTSLKGFLKAASGSAAVGSDVSASAGSVTSVASAAGASNAPVRSATGVSVYACFDNEEVGSNTKQGAMSTFLSDVLHRICICLGKGDEDYLRAVAQSFLVSFDNAHALHPNHPEKSDACNAPLMNHGIVIKENAAQKYVTDAFSRGIFRMICERAGVPCQSFANRSDVAGGSTLGNLSNTQVSLHGVDIGLAQLAMHSSYETAGAADTVYAVQALTAFYQSDLLISGAEEARIL